MKLTNFASMINRLSNNINDTAKSCPTNSDRRTSVENALTTNKTFSTIHSNSPNHILP
ncbi:hypothetical protein HanXRQr2_Chr08g0323511 [Helianthus annuus]|uniref:Uncharacterized protein n=1 Tax=Helianthus annuus TaxID=4232 RepID=A0A9K3ICJ7_HELAN|nr:hypothetical protein HanXRQr2_Chr08g0323511 [Helianthus annuus]